MNLNQVIIIGRLGKDPEIKTLPSGVTVGNLSVATSEVWKDKEGQKQESTEWHKVSLFGKTAENAGKFLKKGMEVCVIGSIQTRSWENKEGVKQYSTEIKAFKVEWTFEKKSPNVPIAELSFGEEPKFDANEEIPF